MIDRMLKFQMNIANQLEELNIINNIARSNGYDDKFVTRIYQTQKSKAELQALTTLFPSVQNELRKELPFLFFPVITNKIQGIFKRYNIDHVYSNDYLMFLKPQENQVSSKLHVKIVKRNTSARQKYVPSQDLRSMSGT
jgi:hypothetical protein